MVYCIMYTLISINYVCNISFASRLSPLASCCFASAVNFYCVLKKGYSQNEVQQMLYVGSDIDRILTEF